MPSVPATQKKPKNDYADIDVLSTVEDVFIAKIFGDPEPYTFSTDVNAYLQINAFSAEPGAIKQFLYSMLSVETADDATEADIARARFDIKRRFDETLASVKGLKAERLVQFLLDLTEIAGNAPQT